MNHMKHSAASSSPTPEYLNASGHAHTSKGLRMDDREPFIHESVKIPVPELPKPKKRRRLEIRTLHGEFFALRVKHWWKPKERKAARLSLKVLDAGQDEIYAEAKRMMNRALFFGDTSS